MIRETVATNSDFFSSLPAEFMVNGNWLGRFLGRKTAVRPHEYKNPEYPKHFDQTRCVFAFEDGRCSLQSLSMELGEYPWSRKPKACWKHPLREEGGVLLPPSINSAEDPDRTTDYLGFATFTSCGMHRSDGKLWYEVLKEELEYYKKYCQTKIAP